MKVKSVEGRRFGNLSVLTFSALDKHGSSLWLCRCDCGLVRVVNRMHLVNGSAHDCGRKNRCPVVRLRHFFAKVYFAENGCWEWKGTTPGFGYGKFCLSKGRDVNAHIASYTMFIGEVPKGVFILHKCDNPPCVNPMHLFLGSQADNMRDKLAKGRQAKGAGHGRSSLVASQVCRIKESSRMGVKNFVLAKQYGVSRTHIGRIVKGESWKHLESST